MNIQEHLDAFDGWLTSRIDEAHASRKDLAFRDLAPQIQLGANAWEYNLLDPGQRSPQGEGWSIYRLQGVWPEFAQMDAEPPAPASRKSFLGVLAEVVFGHESSKRR